MKTTITMGGTTHDLTPEKLRQIQAILDEPEKWVPEKGEEYWYVAGCGDVDTSIYRGDDLYKEYLAANNVYRTKEEAEKAALRRKGAELRYLPKDGEEYKTLSHDWRVVKVAWHEERGKLTDYYAGMIWHKDTPDEEILAWVKEYKKGYEVTR